MNQTPVNRTYKDSLFRLIFREKTELLSLYNAINDSDYQNPDELIIYTLEDTLYIGRKNDSAFLIDSFLNLFEAQSTWNPNMPLRGASYIIRSLEQYVELNQLNIFSRKPLFIPTPRYYVLYNGVDPLDDHVTLRLSDLYIHSEQTEYALECVATVLNINYGHNQDILNACRKLYEYSYLIEEIRKELAQGYTLSAAIDRAIDTCIQNGILEDLLRKERVRVKNTILFDYDAERHIKSEKEESYQEGYDIGKKDAAAEIFEAQIKHLISLDLSDADICRYANCDQTALNFVRSKLNLL